MDRHICRAKRKDNNEWVEGVYYKQTHFQVDEAVRYCMITSTEVLNYDQALEYFEVDPDTVCQCIGWHDSNKTPIFEKDVVEFVGASTHRDLIWWCNEMSMMTAIPLEGIEFNGFDYWNGNYPKYEYSTFCLMMQDPWGDFKEIKVIGNIIDNPELLKGNNYGQI